MANSSVNAVVGIDIGTRTIKVAELKSSKDNKPYLTGVGIAPTPVGAVDHSGVQDPVALGQAIKKLLSDSGISTKKVVLGLAGQSSVVVRVLDVDRMSMAELKEHMTWEIQRNIPFADTNIVSDFQPINRPGTDPASQMMEVVLAVAPQDAVDRTIALAKNAGVTPIAIDVEPLSLGRALVLSQPELYADRNVCVVNIGASSSSIDVFQKGLLSFPRILPIGGDSFIMAIERSLNVTADEAEVLLREKAEVMLNSFGTAPAQTDFMTPTIQGKVDEPAYQSISGDANEPIFEVEGDNFADNPQTFGTQPASDFSIPAAPAVMPGFEDLQPTAITPPTVPPPSSVSMAPLTPEEQERHNVFLAISNDLEELAGEIRRSIEYYRSRANDTEIDQILICGGTANIRNLDEYLQLAVGIPVSVADPLRSVHIQIKRYSGDYLMQNALLLPVAIGLAMNPFY